ncbi:MAG: hypothetical protein ACI934_000028, partial [Pseudohongiellaceae bacterium]
FKCQVQHDSGIFTDGIEHHRIFKFRCNFTDDMDAFSLKLFEVRKLMFCHHYRITRSGANPRNTESFPGSIGAQIIRELSVKPKQDWVPLDALKIKKASRAKIELKWS